MRFKEGDIVRAVRDDYVGIITTSRKNSEGYPCLLASRWEGQWERHPEGYTSGKIELVQGPEADEIWVDYCAAVLRGDVYDIH